METCNSVDAHEEIYRWIKAIDINNPSRNDHYKEFPNGFLEIQSAAFRAGEKLSVDVASINSFDAEKTKRPGCDTDGVIGLIVGEVVNIIMEDENTGVIDHDIVVKHNPIPDNKAHALICMNPIQNITHEITGGRTDRAFSQMRKSLAKLVNDNLSLRILPKTVK
jgi:hypothetical protein